jgi:hypothetical protein
MMQACFLAASREISLHQHRRRLVHHRCVSSKWNMTMQDNLMRLLMPFLLAIIIWKGTEVMFSKVMRA